MFRWMVSRVTDILLAFIIATIILGYGAYRYPEFFPRQFYYYWPMVLQPKAVQTPQATAPSSQVQEQN